MQRIHTGTALAVALAAGIALAGCNRNNDADTTADTGTPPATDTGAQSPGMGEPAPAGVTVTTVDLGNAVGGDNRVTAPATTFASGDTIHASVETDGPARRLDARWTHLDSDQVVAEEQKDVAAGAQVTDFHISKPDGWPPGRYRLEVSQDGNPVGSSEFEVR